MSHKYQCPFCDQARVGIVAHVLAKHPDEAEGFKKPDPPTRDEVDRDKVECPFCLIKHNKRKLEKHIRGRHEDAAWDLYRANGHLWPRGQKISTPKEIRAADVKKAMAERGPLAAVSILVEPTITQDKQYSGLPPKDAAALYYKGEDAARLARRRLKDEQRVELEAAFAAQAAAQAAAAELEDDLSFIDHL